MYAWLHAHPTLAHATLAAVLIAALLALDAWVRRHPAIRAGGLVEVAGNLLVRVLGVLPGVGPVAVEVLVALGLATPPGQRTAVVPMEPGRLVLNHDDPRAPPHRPPFGPVAVALLALATLALAGCAPGWRERTADRIGCYGPLIEKAIAVIVQAARDPARAFVALPDLWRDLRETIGAPDVRACALGRLAESLEINARAPTSASASATSGGGQKMGGGGDEVRLRDLVRVGIAAEAAP